MTTQNYELMPATSIAVDVQSNPFLAVRLSGFAAQCVTTGNAAGTLKIQASNDAGIIPEAGEHAATGIDNWDDVDGASIAVAGAGPYTFIIDRQRYRWARIAYVATSGTGTMAVRVSAEVTR